MGKFSAWGEITISDITSSQNVTLTASSSVFKTTDNGESFSPNVIKITPTYQGDIKFQAYVYSTDGGETFTNVISNTHGFTISKDVLIISKNCDLFNDKINTMTIKIITTNEDVFNTITIMRSFDNSNMGDGRNLLWNSNFADADTPISNNVNSWGLNTRNTNITATIDKSVKHNGFNTLKAVSAANGDKNDGNDLVWCAYGISEVTSAGIHKQEANYTLSFYAKSSVATQFIVRWGYDSYGDDTTVTLSTDWKRYEIKLHRALTSYSRIIIFKLLTASTVYFSEVKLEKGSSATGWSAAPEDVQTAILSNKSSISDVSSTVDKQAKLIANKVENTTYQNDLKLVKSDLSKANDGLGMWKYEIYPMSLFDSADQGKCTLDVFANNKNLTPSQVVLLDDTKLSIRMDYGDDHIAYAVTFVKMSDKKSLETKFSHDDGGHIYLNGKLIGGSDAYKTNETITLSFVKGWNCLEVVLNKQSSYEGFQFDTTISTLSECEIMNCYYATVTGRESKITNQLVQNTTDIKGVKTTVSNVTSVIGDKGEKFTEFKNEYSTFVQGYEGFKTSVGKTYVTNEKFDNLEIGGRNLLLYSKNPKEHSDYYSVPWFNNEIGTYNGCSTMTTVNQWGRLSILFKKQIIDRELCKAGDVLTYSIYAKTNRTSTTKISCSYRFNGNEQAFWFGKAQEISQSWARYSVTFTVTDKMLSSDSYMNTFGFEVTNTMDTTTDKVYFACPKLEKGNKATDYTPAPEDDEINGQNLVSNLPTNWEQGSVSVIVGNTYAGIKTIMTTRIRPKELIPVSGDITISAVTTQNSTKETLNYYLCWFDANKKALNGINSWYSTFPRTFNVGDAKYMAIVLKWGNGNTVMNPSDISNICLKIERGTSATPFTLAPTDVNGKIVNVESVATQTADQIGWLINKDGSTASSLKLTQNALTAIAENIDLTGKVTFSSFNSDTQNKINSIDTKAGNAQKSADSANTAAKNAQSSIDNLEVGGRNLLRYSGNFENGNYSEFWENNGGGIKLDNDTTYLGKSTLKTTVGNGIRSKIWYELDTNKTYTYSALVKSDKSWVGNGMAPLHFWCSDDKSNSIPKGVTTISYSQKIVEDDINKWVLLTLTFKPKGMLFRPFIYIGTAASLSLNIVYIQLEQGTKATAYSPSSEDISQDATSKANQALSDAKTYSKASVDWVGQNGANTNNMYNMVSKWASGAISDTTTINGGWIATNTITANKIAIGDFTNYSQLNESTAAELGFDVDKDSDDIWFSPTEQREYTFMDFGIDCIGGEEFYVEYDIHTNVESSDGSDGASMDFTSVGLAVMMIGADNSLVDTVHVGMVKSSANESLVQHVTDKFVVNTKARKFNVCLYTEGKVFSGTTMIKNVSIRRKTEGNLIVDGSITANKIAADAIKSKNYVSNSVGSYLNLNDGSFDSKYLKWDKYGKLTATDVNLTGNITATSGKIGNLNLDSALYLKNNNMFTMGSYNAKKVFGQNNDGDVYIGKEGISTTAWNTGQTYIGDSGSIQADMTTSNGICLTEGVIKVYYSAYCKDYPSAVNTSIGTLIGGGSIAFTSYNENGVTNGVGTRINYNEITTERFVASSNGNQIQLNASNQGSIELYGGTPFIDFHYGNSSSDYTSRIIANGDTTLSVTGNFSVDYNLYVGNDLVANSWIYAGASAHYTWKDRLDAYIACGNYNGSNNVYYYAGYHAFYVNGDSGSGMMYINTSGVECRKGFRNSSDRRIKKNFSQFDDNFIDTYLSLNPVQYQFKNSDDDKYHFGFIAQDTEQVLNNYGQATDKSYGICATHAIDPEKAEKLYGEKDMTEEYSLAYDELIAPTTYMVQHTYKELEKVKQEKTELETRLADIEAKLKSLGL